MHLYDHELAWTATWAGVCPKCKKGIDNDSFPCPLCGGKIVAICERGYTDISAQMTLRCENSCFKANAIPCKYDSMPIQGNNLRAKWNEINTNYALGVCAIFILVIGCLTATYGPNVILYLLVSLVALGVANTILFILCRITDGIFKTKLWNFFYVELSRKIHPRSDYWRTFCLPTERERFREPPKNGMRF